MLEIEVIGLEDQNVIELLKTLMDGINKRFDEIDKRFDEVYRRFDELDKRFTKLEQRMDNLEQRFDKFEAQNKLEHQQLMQAIREVDNSRFEIRRVQ